MPESEPPLVSVIIATYNWSSVLRYALKSVLWQTQQDFEVLVVGDGCTDDSEVVVSSFHDPRIRWYNLPYNTGNQSLPNNFGLRQATGRYIAYLGHDDIWHPEHLQSLLETVHTKHADAAFAVCHCRMDEAGETVYQTGLSPTGRYVRGHALPPSSFLGKRDMVDDVGWWRDYREITLAPDLEYFIRMHDIGKVLVASNELTVFKFPSSTRGNCYVDKPCHEQAACVEQLAADSEYRYRAMLEASLAVYREHPHVALTLSMDRRIRTGELVDEYRRLRGLPTNTSPFDALNREEPLPANVQLLSFLNKGHDIASPKYTTVLHESSSLPRNGLLLGFNWHVLEGNEDGVMWRWAENDAEIVVTCPSEGRRTAILELTPGPGVDYQSLTLSIQGEDGRELQSLVIDSHREYQVELDFSEKTGKVFRLVTTDGGKRIETDDRIMNFGLFRLDWRD